MVEAATKKEVDSAAHKAGSSVFDNIDGRTPKFEAINNIAVEMTAEFERQGLGYAEIAAAMAPAEFDRQYRLRADINISPQMDMDSYCQSFGKYGNGDICPIGEGTWLLHDSRRERQIKSMRDSARAFDAEEEIRQQIRGEMEADPNMTTNQAMKILGMK